MLVAGLRGRGPEVAVRRQRCPYTPSTGPRFQTLCNGSASAAPREPVRPAPCACAADHAPGPPLRCGGPSSLHAASAGRERPVYGSRLLSPYELVRRKDAYQTATLSLDSAACTHWGAAGLATVKQKPLMSPTTSCQNACTRNRWALHGRLPPPCDGLATACLCAGQGLMYGSSSPGTSLFCRFRSICSARHTLHHHPGAGPQRPGITAS